MEPKTSWYKFTWLLKIKHGESYHVKILPSNNLSLRWLVPKLGSYGRIINERDLWRKKSVRFGEVLILEVKRNECNLWF